MGATYAASVIIPLLNQNQEWLENAILSAVRQTASTEVIVVTSPRTGPANRRLLSDLAPNFANMRVLEHGPQAGFAGALNLGIARAATERVGFLLSDDWLEPTAVAACLCHDTDIVCTSIDLFEQHGAELRRLDHPVLTLDRFRELALLSQKASYLEHFFLFKKPALLAVGGVDETIGLVGPDDYDLIWTLLERGASVAIVEQRLYNYREHRGDRLTLRPYRDQRADLEKILDKHQITGAEREHILDEQWREHRDRGNLTDADQRTD